MREVPEPMHAYFSGSSHLHLRQPALFHASQASPAMPNERAASDCHSAPACPATNITPCLPIERTAAGHAMPRRPAAPATSLQLPPPAMARPPAACHSPAPVLLAQVSCHHRAKRLCHQPAAAAARPAALPAHACLRKIPATHF